MKRVAAGAVVLLMALSGCSSPSAGPGAGPGTAQAPAFSGSFPVTVEHSLGTTTVEREPTRIVTLGPSDADVALALGVVPVGIHSRYGFERGVGPWAEPALGTAAPTVTGGRQIDYESVAALRPDLIVNVGSSGEKEEQDTLSRIAPTVALPKGAEPYAPRWQDATRLIAQALGRPSQGDRLVTDTEGYLRRIATENPAFAGKTLTYLDVAGGEVFVGGRETTVVTTMRELGFRDTPYVESLPPEEVQSKLSTELLPRIDADAVLVYALDGNDDRVLRDTPGLANLPAVRANRALVLPDLALSSPSVLSIPYGVDRVVPSLRAATG